MSEAAADDDTRARTHIEHPTLQDVLWGRGGHTTCHPGNVQYRNLTSNYRDAFRQANKQGKNAIAKEIVAQWRDQTPRGRFLVMMPTTTGSKGAAKDDTVLWQDIDDKEALQKVIGSLRQRKPKSDLISSVAIATSTSNNNTGVSTISSAHKDQKVIAKDNTLAHKAGSNSTATASSSPTTSLSNALLNPYVNWQNTFQVKKSSDDGSTSSTTSSTPGSTGLLGSISLGNLATTSNHNKTCSPAANDMKNTTMVRAAASAPVLNRQSTFANGPTTSVKNSTMPVRVEAASGLSLADRLQQVRALASNTSSTVTATSAAGTNATTNRSMGNTSSQATSAATTSFVNPLGLLVGNANFVPMLNQNANLPISSFEVGGSSGAVGEVVIPEPTPIKEQEHVGLMMGLPSLFHQEQQQGPEELPSAAILTDSCFDEDEEEDAGFTTEASSDMTSSDEDMENLDATLNNIIKDIGLKSEPSHIHDDDDDDDDDDLHYMDDLVIMPPYTYSLMHANATAEKLNMLPMEHF